jgi:uncharacterized DUF497 family protein
MRHWRIILGGRVSESYNGVEWDEGKSESTLRSRGFDFQIVSGIFDDPFYFEREDLRSDYAERRYVAIGIAADAGIVVVVWTPRGQNRRIISARLADIKEREEYGRFRGAF